MLLTAQDGIAQGLPSGLLFHELVHVVQYRLLGIGGFIRSYVTGWAAAGFAYEAIPLEREAFDLQQRFGREPQRHFRVRTLVSRRLGLSWRSLIRRLPSRRLEIVPPTLASGRLLPMSLFRIACSSAEARHRRARPFCRAGLR